MAKDTPLSYRNLVIYEVYVRNHGPHGTFADVEADLERISSLGVDILWFMPIHPIGQLNKKGSLGCPYSIRDYRAVNPEYGTLEDFKHLIENAHRLGMRVMIDVVYNHTSHDSLLVGEHPEFFHQDANGKPITTVPDWSDVIDLKFPNPGLSEYLIDSLKFWAGVGVDGFRCDVASLLPLDFWLEARREVAKVKPGIIWLAESVHTSFVAFRRQNGLSGLSDSEIYQAFDLTYDYDIWPAFQAAVTGRMPVRSYLDLVRWQDAIYPANYVKMRCTENHDNLRIQRLAPSPQQALAWTAFAAFNKGAFLIYAGQEAAAEHTPSLFDVDKITWNKYPLESFLRALARIKKDPALVCGKFTLLAGEPAITAAWSSAERSLVGIFNVEARTGAVQVPLADGEYLEMLSGELIRVQNRQIDLPESAVILRGPSLPDIAPFYSDLLDFSLPLA